MNENTGVWIDHRQAVIVVLSPSGETRTIVHPGAEKLHTKEMPADDLRQNESTERLTRYYDAVAADLRDAGALLIMGPGEAKGELKKLLESQERPPRTITLETADHMTEPQVAARVRHHFHQDAPRIL